VCSAHATSLWSVVRRLRFAFCGEQAGGLEPGADFGSVLDVEAGELAEELDGLIVVSDSGVGLIVEQPEIDDLALVAYLCLPLAPLGMPVHALVLRCSFVSEQLVPAVLCLSTDSPI